MAKEQTKKTGNKKEAPLSLTQRAYEEVKWRIIADELRAGMLLTENDLCDMTGFGKAPIRAALIELRHDKLIEVVPRKGFFVRPWSWDEARELIAMRRLIEPELAAKAAANADEDSRETLKRIVREAGQHVASEDRRPLIHNDNEFHVAIAAASGIAVGAEIVEMLKLRSHYLWHVSISSQARLETVQVQHEEILQKILDRDPEGAAVAMVRHLSLLETE